MDDKYTLEELKKVPEIITELYYLSEGKGNGNDIFERSRVFLQGTEFENIEFDDTLDPEEFDELIIDMLTVIENKIPDDKFVSIVKRLDPEVFDVFYYDETHRMHPELMGIGMRKSFETAMESGTYYLDAGDRETALNNMSTTNRYINDLHDETWATIFGDGFWANLTPEEQSEHFDEVLNMIDSSLTNSELVNRDGDYRKIKLLMGTSTELREEIVPKAIEHLSRYKLDLRNCFEIKNFFSNLIANAEPEVQDVLLKQIIDGISNIDKLYDSDYMIGLNTIIEVLRELDKDVIKNNSKIIFDKIDEMTDERDRESVEILIWEYRECFPLDRDLSRIPCNIDRCLVDDKIYFNDSVDYLQYVLSRDKYAIFNNAYANHIYQAMNANLLHNYNLTDEQINIIKGLYDAAEIGKDDIEPDMSKFEEKLFSKEQMSKEEFDAFCENLKVLKNLHGRLPEKYCDYIIKQKFTKDSILNKEGNRYKSVLDRAFEDKISYVLKEQGEEEILIHVSNFEGTKKSISGAAGFFDKNGIVAISSAEIQKLSLSYFRPLETVFHEARHAVQNKHLENGEFVNPKEYIMLKENLIKEKRPEYYVNNYRYNAAEIDARLAGLRGAIRYLKSLGFSEQEIIHNNDGVFKEYYKAKLMAEYEMYDNNTFLKKDKDNSEKSLNEMFSEIVKEDPEILQKHPVLAIEFNEDGTRKSRIGVLSKFDDVLDEIRTDKSKVKSSNFRVYQEILKDYTGMDARTVIEEVEDAVNLQLKNKPFEKILDRIVEKGGLKLFSESMANGEIEINPEDTDEERKKNFLRLKSGLESYSKAYPDRDVSKKIEEELNRFNSLGKIEISEINVDTSSITDRTQSDDEWDR